MNIDPARTNPNPKPVAILALTENGFYLAERLAQYFPQGTVYLPARLEELVNQKQIPLVLIERTGKPLNHAVVYFDDWHEAFAEAFQSFSGLICIMATGIVVRSLASLMVSKLTDPAILVLDEKGEYVISLLSGHIGGANQMAREIAAQLGGQAVITTASDVEGKSSVDLLAQELDAVMDPVGRIKTINRYLVEGKTVHLYSPWPLLNIFSGFEWQGWIKAENSLVGQGFSDDSYAEGDKFSAPPDISCSQAGMLATSSDLCSPVFAGAGWLSEFLEPAVLISPWKLKVDPKREWMQLRPRNLVVGIGCRKGVDVEEVEQAFEQVMKHFCLDTDCVQKLATIDFKTREAALQELAARLKVPLLGFSAEEIRTLDGTYEASAWVNEKIGVGGVCEPAARLAAGQGIILVPKQKIGAVTISVAMEKSWWWDWDPVSEI